MSEHTFSAFRAVPRTGVIYVTTEAQKLLSAELQSLDRQGRLRTGFSSLWGHFGGIYVNTAAVSIQLED